jgi:nitroimidazol reductase NimA-like FMN-containing flavoprotein (pyridoxamine 5'-phosphate oxidase superfamily)
MADGRNRAPGRLVELTPAEALRLLADVPYGRIVFTHRALPAIRPVNHIVDAGDVIIRTHVGAGAMAAATDGMVVAYEADVIDPDTRVGWSVVVTGVARVVADAHETARYLRLLHPWVEAGPARDRVIRIRPDIVTGFRLTDGAGDLAAAGWS